MNTLSAFYYCHTRYSHLFHPNHTKFSGIFRLFKNRDGLPSNDPTAQSSARYIHTLTNYDIPDKSRFHSFSQNAQIRITSYVSNGISPWKHYATDWNRQDSAENILPWRRASIYHSLISAEDGRSNTSVIKKKGDYRMLKPLPHGFYLIQQLAPVG